MNNNNKEAPIGQTFTLDSLFANLPTETETIVDLPSRGKFYKNSVVSIRPMTFEDEKSMLLSRKEGADSLNTLLSKCTKGIDISELLIMDKLYLILKLREISYGDSYDVTVGCPQCNHDNKMSFKLSHLNKNEIPEDETNPKEIVLPVTGVKLVVRYPKVIDEKYLKDEATIYANLWRFVVSINGVPDLVLISNFLKDTRVPIKDMHVVLREIMGTQYGIDTKVKFQCEKCKTVTLTNLPLGADFFTVS